MQSSTRWNLGLALLLIASSLVTLVWWIPMDIESGLVIEERRAIVVGDALAPTIATVGILLFSLALALSTFLGGAATDEPKVGVSRANALNLAAMALILVVSLGLMVWAGPATVAALQSAGFEVKEYRLLTSTVPYKYIGFVLGGVVLVAGLIAWIEGRFTWRALLTGVGAVTVLIIVYDLPFDTLLLPPNGSQ